MKAFLLVHLCCFFVSFVLLAQLYCFLFYTFQRKQLTVRLETRVNCSTAFFYFFVSWQVFLLCGGSNTYELHVIFKAFNLVLQTSATPKLLNYNYSKFWFHSLKHISQRTVYKIEFRQVCVFLAVSFIGK